MKPTDDLKKKLKAAKTADEAKRAIEEAGRQLTDDELEEVSGGVTISFAFQQCPICKQTHEFLTTYPWCVRSDGEYVMDATQYWSSSCSFSKYKQYGRTRYCDENDNPLEM